MSRLLEFGKTWKTRVHVPVLDLSRSPRSWSGKITLCRRNPVLKVLLRKVFDQNGGENESPWKPEAVIAF